MSLNNGYLLPPELLQVILMLMDFESFYLASLTCRLWRNAASSTHVLRHQLKTVPSLAKSASLLHGATSHELRALFQQVCRSNLIGIRHDIQFKIQVSKPTSTSRMGDTIPVRSRHGIQIARLRGMTLTLDSSPGGSKYREVQLSPSIFPSSDAMKQIMGYAQNRAFFAARSFACLQATMSDCGTLLAVALGQKLHVYFLQLGKEAQPVEVDVSDTILDSIQSVEFAENDELLRCEVDGVEGSYVRYMGFPRCRCNGARPITSGANKFRYWRLALRHVYLDSKDVEGGLGSGVLLCGMRAVSTPRRRGRDGLCMCRREKRFFSLFRRGSGKNGYGVGVVSKDGAVEIVQHIPTRHPVSSLQNAAKTSQRGPVLRFDRWDAENLPLARYRDPLLTASDDEKILAIFEPPHGQSYGALYICAGDTMHSLAWPFSLCALEYDLDSLRVTYNDKTGGYVVGAHSQRHSMQWTLPEIGPF
ncbi:hypothetical protein BJX76DRAFT_317844 [Aspergillus varians]